MAVNKHCRERILASLDAHAPMSVPMIAAATGLSQPSVRHALRVLRDVDGVVHVGAWYTVGNARRPTAFFAPGAGPDVAPPPKRTRVERRNVQRAYEALYVDSVRRRRADESRRVFRHPQDIALFGSP